MAVYSLRALKLHFVLLYIAIVTSTIALTQEALSSNSAEKTEYNVEVLSNEFGLLALCPPGGKSFMMAWSIACEIRRRRRKRSSPQQLSLGSDSVSRHKRSRAPPGFRPASMSEIMKICCYNGCEAKDLLAYCDPFGSWDS